jgi:hypothetical protein
MSRPPSPCYLCSRFSCYRDEPPPHGYCEGYEKIRRHDDTNEGCPLWNLAKDEAQRKRWAEQQPKETV